MTEHAKPMPPSERKRILVVDDSHADSMLLKIHLEQTNAYVVREVNEAAGALAAAGDFRPHLILLDVMMPGMDGGELAAEFHGDATLRDVPIVFLTAAVTKREVEAGGGEIGGYPFLAKPVVLSEVVACLEQQLSRQPPIAADA